MTHNIKNPPCPRTRKIHKDQARSNSEDTNKTKTLSSKKQNQIQQPQKTNIKNNIGFCGQNIGPKHNSRAKAVQFNDYRRKR